MPPFGTEKWSGSWTIDNIVQYLSIKPSPAVAALRKSLYSLYIPATKKLIQKKLLKIVDLQVGLDVKQEGGRGKRQGNLSGPQPGH